eukprot:444990-Pyramimonas_sp.AAC.1
MAKAVETLGQNLPYDRACVLREIFSIFEHSLVLALYGERVRAESVPIDVLRMVEHPVELPKDIGRAERGSPILCKMRGCCFKHVTRQANLVAMKKHMNHNRQRHESSAGWHVKTSCHDLGPAIVGEHAVSR